MDRRRAIAYLLIACDRYAGFAFTRFVDYRLFNLWQPPRLLGHSDLNRRSEGKVRLRGLRSKLS